ncbi:ABC transporter substrate-binding protein [Paenibacillus ginsengarvi]|uniref:ABC transporter substrate-binding protein n=1 Tax=Paenibacillus ginsengarvi TaxID=400777 RepID=UPI00131509DA|nr:extracellular solute-binding protein [Paenibacillus ginsengarvi]
MQKRIVFALAIVLAFLLVAGCGGERQPAAENSPVAENPPKPVKLKVFFASNVGNDYYNTLVVEPIKKTFPHITLELIPFGQKLPDLLASGNAPDLIFDGLTNLIPTLELDVPLSLDELAKRNKFDFSKIQPEVIKEIRSYSKTDELLAWPQANHWFGLHYNKDIFDLFGVPYPKEGSTWEEVMELAAKLSRTYEGIEYRGISPGVSHNRLSTQLSAPYAEPKTEKSMIGTHESWRKLFQTYKDVFSIPGNYPKGAAYNDAAKAFMTEKKLAMYPHLLMFPDPKLGFNMGVTTFPFFKDKPWVGPSGFIEVIVISKTTKNPDAAFQVVAHLTSDEVQTRNARLGMNPVVTNSQAQMSLFADLPAAKGTDLTPFFKMKHAESYGKTIYDAAGSKAVIKYLQEFIDGKLDLNTALARADEETNKAIEEQKKK